jgi:hypothetical protein
VTLSVLVDVEIQVINGTSPISTGNVISKREPIVVTTTDNG